MYVSFHIKALITKLVSSSFRLRKDGKGLHRSSNQQGSRGWAQRQVCWPKLPGHPQKCHFLEPSGSWSPAQATLQSQLPGPVPEAWTLPCCGLPRTPWKWLLPLGFAPSSYQPPTAVSLAKFLSLSVDWLIGRTEDPNSSADERAAQSPRALGTRRAPSPWHCSAAQRGAWRRRGRVPEARKGRAVPGWRRQVSHPTRLHLPRTVASVAQVRQAAPSKSNRRPLTTTCAPGSARGLGLMSGDTM